MINDRLTIAINYVEHNIKGYLENNQTPGAGLCIVRNGQTLVSSGYGYANIEKGTPFTNQTVMLIASISKPVTGTMVSILQRQKDIKNTKVNITMIDPYLTNNLTVSDLLSHYSGIPTQYGTYGEMIGYTREELINRLYRIPNENFRSSYNYTNIPFTQGAEVALKEMGLTLDQGYQYLFNTLDMRSSSVNYQPGKYEGYVNLKVMGTTNEIVWYPSFEYNMTEQVSAGGVYSTVEDMGKFMKFHLKQQSLPDDQKIIDPQFYLGIHVSQQNFNVKPPPIPLSLASVHGLGINMSYNTIGNDIYRTYKYSGALENVRTSLLWSPELDIGIFVSTNSSPNGYPEALIAAFMSILVGSDTQKANSVLINSYHFYTDNMLKVFPPVSFSVEGDPVCFEKNSVYLNRIHGKVYIYRDGTIQLGKLPPVKLLSNNNEFVFLLYGKYKIPYKGTVTVIDNNIINIKYYDTDDNYHLIETN